MNITIKVTGPGTCFKYEMNLLKRTLEEAGYAVNVIDEYPLTGTPQERLNEIARLSLFKRPDITLIADHCPWGG